MRQEPKGERQETKAPEEKQSRGEPRRRDQSSPDRNQEGSEQTVLHQRP